MDSSTIYDQVREHYSAASKTTSAKYSETVAKSFGYSDADLSSIPDGANLGLSCGNPLAITSLQPGETVIDLGSGAGFDVFLAASRIGPSGRAIGIDMNDDMLARASSILSQRSDLSSSTVSFVKGNITAVPLPDSTADIIISNCVINLVPHAEKHLVFQEMHRLLKPGGRVAVSDILAKKPLPQKLRQDIAMYVGCIAGAAEVKEYENWFAEAGFTDVVIADTNSDLNVYLETNEDGTMKGDCCAPPGTTKPSGCCAPASTPAAAASEDKTDLNEYVGSFKIYAVKQ
ncbi:S-adenosyl-L-methionine-dependent methyltransferase [Podospora australis]|uniref:Arsenite methyltransferase n=1 Tax=Podospora australis TaxID=1536484 RepID=A0AAN6X2Z7_9PEZI|nr:S-adenosyl-L-methionine-dependent methyltransferase [Podospora australis]